MSINSITASSGLALLNAGDKLESANGKWEAALQNDGNLVVRNKDTQEAAWNAGTNGQGADAVLAVQRDGNLVVYGDPGVASWDSKTGSSINDRPMTLVMQDDGNLVLYDTGVDGKLDSGDRARWSSQTGALVRPGISETDRINDFIAQNDVKTELIIRDPFVTVRPAPELKIPSAQGVELY